jgi:hypothetical protein
MEQLGQYLASMRNLTRSNSIAANVASDPETVGYLAVLASLDDYITGGQLREFDVYVRELAGKAPSKIVIAEFFRTMVANGISFAISFEATKQLVALMNMGKSYNESVIHIAEQLQFQTPEVQRILIYQFMHDMMIRGYEVDCDSRDLVITAEAKKRIAEASKELDNLVRLFFEECHVSFEERWRFVQVILLDTKGLDFDVSVQVAMFGIDLIKRPRTDNFYAMCAVVIHQLCNYLRQGISFSEAKAQVWAFLNQFISRTDSSFMAGVLAARQWDIDSLEFTYSAAAA